MLDELYLEVDLGGNGSAPAVGQVRPCNTTEGKACVISEELAIKKVFPNNFSLCSSLFILEI